MNTSSYSQSRYITDIHFLHSHPFQYPILQSSNNGNSITHKGSSKDTHEDCIVQWLTRSPDTREIPSSSLGIVIFLFSSIPQSPSFCHAGCYVHALSVFALRRLRYALHAAARLPGRLEYRSLSSFIVDMRSMFSIFAYYFSQAIVGFSCIEFGDAGYLLLTYFTLGRRSPFSLTLRKRTLS